MLTAIALVLSASQVYGGAVTVAHTSFGAPGVDVVVDGAKVATGLEFGHSATIDAPGGLYEVELQAGGATVLKRKLNVFSSVPGIDIGQTIYAVNPLEGLTLSTLEHDVPRTTEDHIVFRYHHLVADAPAVTVITTNNDGRQVCIDATLEYGDATSVYCFVDRREPQINVAVTLPGDAGEVLFKATLKPAEIPAGTYGVSVIGSAAAQQLGAAIIPLSGAKPSLNLTEAIQQQRNIGTLRGAAAAAPTQAKVLPMALAKSVPSTEAFPAMQNVEAATVPIRVVHGCADAPAVNVLVDGAKVATLKYLQYTPYVPVGAGNHKVQLQLESGTVVLERPLYVSPPSTRAAPESFRTVVAVGSALFGTLDLAVYNDGEFPPEEVLYRQANLFESDLPNVIHLDNAAIQEEFPLYYTRATNHFIKSIPFRAVFGTVDQLERDGGRRFIGAGALNGTEVTGLYTAWALGNGERAELAILPDATTAQAASVVPVEGLAAIDAVVTKSE